mmetsp:Transcript_12419/g.39708  ORF Transcript_12419/g.39708 Transcript_12419/m.39708 type:complete len:384 (-) Transcript_12419:82-1233(-)
MHHPPLRLLNAHVQLLCQHTQIETLVHAAVGLEDEQTRLVHEARGHRVPADAREEKVTAQHGLALAQRVLRRIKVKVDEQLLHEAGGRVPVRVPLLLHCAHQVRERGGGGAPALLQHHGCRQVAQQPRAVVLQRAQEVRPALRAAKLAREAKVHQHGEALGVAKVDEQAPMEQPGPLLQLLQRCARAALDQRLELIVQRHSGVQVAGQQSSSQLPPQRGLPGGVLIVDQLPVELEQLARRCVLPSIRKEFGQGEESSHVGIGGVVLVAQSGPVELIVCLKLRQLLGPRLAGEQGQQRPACSTQLLSPLGSSLLLGLYLGWRLDAQVRTHFERLVHQIRPLQHVQPRAEHVCVWVHLALADKIKHPEHEVRVHEGRQPSRHVVR